MKHSQISYTALGNTTEFAFNKYIVYRMPALKYIKQLDSIRAIAVILVIKKYKGIDRKTINTVYKK
jgi:hypothetical protein